MAMRMWDGSNCCKCGKDLTGEVLISKSEWSEEEGKVNHTCLECGE